MGEVVFLNGKYVSHSQANVSIFDRGLLFGDGIYEVTAVVGGKLLDLDRHLERLNRSAAEIGLTVPYSAADWTDIHRALIEANGLQEGIVYIQITRGTAEREFAYPSDCIPTIIGFTQRKALCSGDRLGHGIHMTTFEDLRWKRRDIKSTSLLAQILAKQKAANAGTHEALMHEDGFVTERGSTSVFAVDHDGTLKTRPVDNGILAGITREVVLEIALGRSDDLRIPL